MKLLTVVGARPQFIKATAVSHTIRERYQDRIEEVLLHTGQHFDDNMSGIFFEELDIPEPRYNLGISGGTHGEMTGRMIAAIESTLLRERPDHVLVYGDTNSTLAASLAAVKLRIPIAHVEAGVRSFRLDMPEEVNRLLTDRVSSMLFCPTATAVTNLASEGIRSGVYDVGDVTCDLLLRFGEIARHRSSVLERLRLEPRQFALVTCHRPENTDHPANFLEILQAVSEVAAQLPVVFPLHPRARKMLPVDLSLRNQPGLHIVDPQPFLDMLALEQAARMIITDSGGIQKEAFCFKVPCITLRDETEWVETIDLGANILVGASRANILGAFLDRLDQGPLAIDAKPFGTGHAGEAIASLLAA